MKAIHKTHWATALALVLTLSVSWAEDPFIKLSPLQISNLGIKTAKLEPVSHVPLFSAPATVVLPPANDFIVSSSLAGLVVKMNASVGDKVAKGDVLVWVNSPEFLALQGNYLKAKSALKLASASYEREQKLHKEGVASGRSQQEAASIYSAAVIEAKQSSQLLQMAGMLTSEIRQLDETGKLISQIKIRSPVDGRVVERMATTGSRVDNQTPLYRVADLDELWLEINLPQEHIDEVKIGEKLVVEDGLAEAEIKVLGQSVNPDNQTVLARALIKGNPVMVRVGQKVTIQHLQSKEIESYRLSDGAITSYQGKSFIFLKEDDGFKVREVKVLGKQLGVSVISGDLLGTEEIAVNNTVALKASWLGLGSDE